MHEGVYRKTGRGRRLTDPLSARQYWNPMSGDFKIGSHDPAHSAKQEWQNVVESDMGWAVPFAWPEKLGAQAGMWGPGGITDPIQPQMMPAMGAAAGGLGSMNFYGGGGGQELEDILKRLKGQQTQGAGNVAGTLQNKQPYNLGGLGSLT